MSLSVGYKSLSLAVVSALAATAAHSAGLDRSGQDVTAFLQDGTYAEFVYTYIDADISGHDNGVPSGASTKEAYVKGNPTGDLAKAYDFFRFGVKADVNDRFSVGVIYDEPFGAAVQYQGNSNFVAAGGESTFAALASGTPLERLQPNQAKDLSGVVADKGFLTPVDAFSVLTKGTALDALNQKQKESLVEAASKETFTESDAFAALTAGSPLENQSYSEIETRVRQYDNGGRLIKKQISDGVKRSLIEAARAEIRKTNPTWDASQVNAAARAAVTDEKVTEAINGMRMAVESSKAVASNPQVQVAAAASQGLSSPRAVGALAATATAEAQKGQGTSVDIHTHNTTLLMGAKFGEKRSFQIYGGPAAQHLTGEVHLRGVAYQGIQGYDARISPNTAIGWVAGIAYHKPEIALRASLTYRSEIEHETQIAEVVPALAARGVTTRDFKVSTPESYNLDFQTGVNPTTLLTAKVRYVPWSKFDIRPPTYGDVTATVNNGQSLPIVSYSKDQWSAEIGLGKKLSDRVAASISYGYDSGAGNPTTTLGPIRGYHSLGLGAKVNVTPKWSVSAGGKYLYFGDATANLPTGATVGQFEKNDGYAVGVKLAYQAK